MVHSALSGGDPAATSNVRMGNDVSNRRHARWNMRAVQIHDVVPEYEESLDYPVHRRTQQELDERVVRMYQSLVERVHQPDFGYIHKGYLLRAHSAVRDSLFLPYEQHMVPYAIQFSDLAPARYTVMLQWKMGQSRVKLDWCVTSGYLVARTRLFWTVDRCYEVSSG